MTFLEVAKFMKSKSFAFISILCLSLTTTTLTLLTGCKPSPEKIAVREALLNREVEKHLASIQKLIMEGNVDEAAAQTKADFDNPKYVTHRSRFFSQLIDLMLMQEQDAEASAEILSAWGREPELAKAVFGRMHNHYSQRNQHAALLRWCKSLLAIKTVLPNEMRTQVLGWQLNAALATADEKEAQSACDAILSLLKPEEAAPMFQSALGSQVDAGNHAFVRSLVSYLEGKKTESPLYRNLFVTLTMRCVIATKDWDNVVSVFSACATQLPDDQLLKISRSLFSVLQKSNPALLDPCTKQVIFNALEKTNSVNYAARVWVESGVSANKKVLVERLDALLNAKVSPIQVGNLFDRYFYEMVDDLDMIKSLCVLGNRILASSSDENTVNNVKVKVLDGAFITDNFDLAVEMLEQGIPGKDKAWHDMSLPKVKAHRAMAQNQPREAVKFFRQFMDAWIASEQEEEYDPTSGIAYSREWILGRNAKRIAGILDAIPDKAEADKARAEAKDYFKGALRKAENDPEALKLLKEEVKDIGL